MVALKFNCFLSFLLLLLILCFEHINSKYVIDVASGCRYLEEHHFIHRDIAARNCLLTRKVKLAPSPDSNQTNQVLLSDGTVLPFDTKEYSNGFHNSGIIVKIADFGMSIADSVFDNHCLCIILLLFCVMYVTF